MGAARDFFVGGLDWDGMTGRGPVVVGLILMVLIMLVAAPLANLSGGLFTARQVDSALSSLVLVQLYGTIVRRLHDAGRSGFWLLLAILPYMPILMMLALLALPRAAGNVEQGSRLWRRIGFFLAVGLALFLVSRLFWTDHLVEGDQMDPTLQRGDWVAAATYFRSPQRGDIVISRGDLALRIVGLAGERVAEGEAGISIDGADVPVGGAPGALFETLPGGSTHAVVPLAGGGSSLVAEIPEGYVLLLGDNRAYDAAFASPARLSARMVPESHVRARVVRVLASSDTWRGSLPAWLQGMRWGRIGLVPQ